MIRRLCIVSVIALALAGSSAAILPTAASAEMAILPSYSVDGTWHLHTNDCFFGVCDYTLHLISEGREVDSAPGSHISGKVNFNIITLYFTGVSPEDNWSCSAYLNSNIPRFTGSFTDGTGGSGKCHGVRTGP